MRDLDSPEQRAKEREILRAARDEKHRGARDYTHVAIAGVLFLVAIVFYALGQGSWAGLVLLGAIAEIGAWAILMNGGRGMPPVEAGGASAERPRDSK